MSEIKFSEGPWSVQHEVDENGLNIWWVNSPQFGKSTIAKCFNPYDAQLIAVAPDMHEALKECLSLFALGANAISKKGVNFEEKRAKAREIERKVFEALAKAEGGWPNGKRD